MSAVTKADGGGRWRGIGEASRAALEGAANWREQLRRAAGLDNVPIEGLNHPLLATPLGRLQAPAPEPADPLLLAIANRVECEILGQ